MSDSKKINIIAITDYSNYGDSAVRYGGVLSAIFRASLTIISNFVFKEINKKNSDKDIKNDIWKEEIGQFHDAISNNHPQISINFNRSLENLDEHNIENFVLHDEFTAKQLYKFADQSNTVMIVIGVPPDKQDTVFDIKRAIKFIKKSRIPVMTVGNKVPEASVFKNVILPLDISRSAKEKVLWAGYFSRFYTATVHVLYTSFKDKFLKDRMNGNVAFTEKLYNNLDINYKLYKLHEITDNIDKFSLSYSSKIDASLTIIMMTKYYTIYDCLFGVKESRIIGNKEGLPVLCINERDDLYVLCT